MTISDPPGDGQCYFCDKNVDGDYFCYGCGEYVCGDCDVNGSCMGEHSVEDHEEEME